jgi:hypothetical protein
LLDRYLAVQVLAHVLGVDVEHAHDGPLASSHGSQYMATKSICSM